MRARFLLLSLAVLLFGLAVPVTAQHPLVDQLPHPTTPHRIRGANRAGRGRKRRPLSSSSWTAIGPAPLEGGISFSGRITGIAAHPADANTIYIAAAGGGVWKTIDGGSTWSPLTDGQATLSLGAIAIAPSDPSVIYAGTGEANNSADSNYGRGLLISSDGGTSWTLSTGPSGIFDRLTTSQLAVDPTNSSVAYAAISGVGNNASCCAPGATGIWKTTDGGTSWTNMTALNGLPSSLPWTAVTIDPNDNRLLFAAVGLFFGHAANGVYKSTNAGASWTLLSTGPTGAQAGRITLALAPSNSQVLYVVAAAPYPMGGLYKVMRSDDGGATFTDLTAGTPNFVGSQGWYDLVVVVDPATSSMVYLGGSTGGNAVLSSTDSGAHWFPIGIGGPPDFVSPHVDHHAFTFDANGQLLDGDDGGIFRLDDPTIPSWSDLNGDLNTIQFYGIGLHPTDTSIAIGGSQDNGTEVFSGSLTWTETDGGDGGFAKISRQDGSLAYHQIPISSFGPNFFRVSTDGGQTWNTATSGIVADQNFQNFTAPFDVDPSDGERVLYGTNRVWETTNAGTSWTPISNIGVGGWSSNADIFVDAIGLAPSDANTIYAAESPFHAEVFVTTDHGASWREHEVVPLTTRIGDVQVDPIDSGTAYAVINQFSSMGNVFRTTDGGVTWTSISGDLPNEPVWSVQIDPTTAPHTLYVGADDGVYVSRNSGVSWSRFGEGLPDGQAVQLELNPTLHLLGVATHGRGMWEILTRSPSGSP
jgi:photosystem II stability/assembly factor-like uncharacterized protein